LNEIVCIPAMRFASVDGLPTSVVSFATDIPMFGRTWGEPLLFGPGSIHVAHTSEERISKRELTEAIGTYADMVKKLLAED
jgi:acetylornithine deacetylase